MTTAPGISLRNVCKTYRSRGGGEVVALQGMDLECPPGSFTALIGPSGCGKSTAIILGGLRINAPNAVLGAILAGFGGGGRWGLGSYLLGLLGRGEPARLLGIGLTATLIAGLSYVIFAPISARILGSTRSVTLSTARPPDDRDAHASLLQRLSLTAGAAALPFVLWWAFIQLTGVHEMIAKIHWDVVEYLFLGASALAQAKLGAALLQTRPITALGMMAGLGIAFVLAISSRMIPGFIRAFMPIALVSDAASGADAGGRPVRHAVDHHFGDGFVLLVQGSQPVPQSVLDLPRAYGASAWKELWMMSIPAAWPSLFVATRLTVPRALLGVMIAEWWLASGAGLGNLLNQSRGYLDDGMIWTAASVSALLSVAFYCAVLAAVY